jgi:uncharacterized membrane protein YhhN
MSDSANIADTTPAYSTTNRLLLGISAGFALAYLLCLPLEPFAGLVVIKGLGVFLLSVVAWRLAWDTNGRLLALGLLISSVGDVFLRLDPVGMFVHGLGSFLVAHLVYVALFLRLRPRPLALVGHQRGLIALFIIYGLGLGGWMLPNLGAYAAPVLVYAAAITVMGITCVLVRFSNPWVVVGAISFIASDSAIAIDKFIAPVEGIGWFIWPSYYIGQLLIMTGVIAAMRLARENKARSV